MCWSSRSVDRGSTWTNPGGINLSGTIDYDNEDGILAGGGCPFLED